jgi:arylsulfatase A
MRMKKLFFLGVISLLFSCGEKVENPNVILIMADDMGSECLSINGAAEYKTPNLDRLSQSGMRFTNVFSQPLCTPSRVKLMTGKHNYRNYEYFGYLNPNQKTIGNLMKEAGYKTAISGKWQLNGLSFEMPGHEDVTRPYHFGFDEYCLWQLSRPKKDGERFADPLIYKNGEEMTGLEDKYGPDVFADFICGFIDKHAEEPFFIYYPMVLVHNPFVPTPDSPEWNSLETRSKSNPKFFKDMVDYTDKIIGKIEQKLIEHGIDQNTILIFTGDNGTNIAITTQTKNGPYPGGKSYTTQRGVHVPFVVSWPGGIQKNGDYNGLVDFNDFYPTLGELTGLNVSDEILDGQSFLPVLKGDFTGRKNSTLIHYDPMWGKASKSRNRFALTNTYKLYQDGSFFHFENDIEEETPKNALTPEQETTKRNLQTLLDQAEASSPWKENKKE